MLEIEFLLPDKFTDILSEYLLEIGAVAVTLRDAEDNPIFEPKLNTLPLWPEIKLSALFSEEHSLEEILLNLYTCPEASHILHIEQRVVEDQDWVRQTQALTQPRCFAGKLWVYPSWHSVPDDTGVKILLDPGLAFGTGEHATTKLMLTWLAENSPEHLTVLDYGCGSGILAIAAAKLGASQVYGTDIDAQALTTTQENALANGVNLWTGLPEKLPPNLKVDLILANILAEPLLQLVDRFTAYLKPHGRLVLSGILISQIEALQKAYEKHFSLDTASCEGEWARMVLIAI